MKVAILNLTAGGMSGGYRKYLESILVRITHLPEMTRILIVVPQTVDLSELKKNCTHLTNLDWYALKMSGKFLLKGSSALKNKIKEFSPDVIFVPTARYWKIKGIPVVVMVRNMEPFVEIDNNSLFAKVINILRLREVRKSVKNADRIITVSDFVKNTLISKFNIPSKKIGTIYHGIDMPRISLKKEDSISRKMIIEKPFLFTAGSIRPARGLEDIINALSNYPFIEKKGLQRLVIAGETISSMRSYKKDLMNLIERYKLSRRCIFIGPLNKDDMSWFYHHCYAFIMTSRVEACPNIALEAMAHGCVCVSTDSQPMPEIFKDAALYYPAKNPQILFEKIRMIMNWDDKIRRKLSDKAVERARDFSWETCAIKTLNELKIAKEDFKRIQESVVSGKISVTENNSISRGI